MSESRILADVRIALSKLGVRIWRNNCGQYFNDNRHVIRYGVANPGGSDLIGFRSVLVTPDMVGSRMAVFVAVECKAPNGRATPEQRNFLEQVAQAGGIAILAHSAEEAVEGLSPSLAAK